MENKYDQPVHKTIIFERNGLEHEKSKSLACGNYHHMRSGQEITVTFAIGGYTDIRDGVNALKGTLEFDTDVFEEVSGEDFETLNFWEQMFYNPKNGQFVLINRAENGRAGKARAGNTREGTGS